MKPQYLTITELAQTPVKSLYTRIMPRRHLKYCAPGVEGMGMLQSSLLVPESALLFVAPAGCARHVAMHSYRLGLKNRLFLLRVDENDIVTGAHLDRIPAAMEEIMSNACPKPRALFLGSSCVDTLLASDYKAIAKKLEAKYGIRVRASYMDPIMFDGKKSPDRKIQHSMYDFIAKNDAKEKAVNIIGSYAPVNRDSEFYSLLAKAGFDTVRHISECTTLEELDRMGQSTLNIVIKSSGSMAAAEMEKKHGIPFISLPVSYNLDTIRNSYRKLGEALGIEIYDDIYYEQTKQVIKEFRQHLGSLRIAIGKTIKGNVFDLAHALIQYGFRVSHLFINKFTQGEKPHIMWLAEHQPEMGVFSGDHPTIVNLREEHLPVDLAIGLDASYFCPDAAEVSWDVQDQPYGYRGIVSLLEKMTSALKKT